MLCQTSIKGCCPSLAALESWHWVRQNKKKLKLGETLRHKRDTMNPGLWSWLQKHFADCSPSVPEEEDSPLCCRRLVPPISLFQQFFTRDGSLKELLPPGLSPWLTQTFCSSGAEQMQDIIWPISNDCFHFLKHLPSRKVMTGDTAACTWDYETSRYTCAEKSRKGRAKSWDLPSVEETDFLGVRCPPVGNSSIKTEQETHADSGEHLDKQILQRTRSSWLISHFCDRRRWAEVQH